ncbi:GMP synthase-Glutamine amidotransferase [Ruegeria halocynthiae]|uniref:GMP synthase-Glutamine amidotransferase n=1 Tax=Ruegeria halocynthiae TaxID=985054 RepID=A0A1H2YHG5_9RHOB|nr:type 1 glutamine amidotransferase [Ruegeria halocynthiae]SDX04074.1 GMP synthase-Glutamine amidotransferase [Ruegeria halocynthiae]
MSDQKLRVGILETGRPPEELAPTHGDYPGMVQQWLGNLDADFSSYAVLDEEFPASPNDADLWVITGSKFGAYEDHPWIPPLEEFIRGARDSGKLMFGICFGHQMIAQALGGVVRKSDKGWGLGVHEYPTTGKWPGELGDAPEKIAIQAYHQDQVEEKPEGAVTIASTDFCEHGALWYPGFAVTVQGHPEFAKPYASDLLESRRGTVLKDEDVDQGQRNMAIEDNRSMVANLIREYLLKQKTPA